METNKLQEMWTDFDKKISENTRLNKEILKKLLTSKSERRFSKMILKVGIEVVVIIIMLVYFFVKYVSFQPTLVFSLALTIFVAAIGIPIIGHIRYFLMLYKINFSESVLSLRKKINESERLKGKNIRRDRFMVLFLLISTWFISQDFKDVLTFHSKIFGEPLYVVTLIFSVIVSVIVVLSIKHFRDKTLDRLNSELTEIEELERD
jgi:hypothetical protein